MYFIHSVFPAAGLAWARVSSQVDPLPPPPPLWMGVPPHAPKVRPASPTWDATSSTCPPGILFFYCSASIQQGTHVVQLSKYLHLISKNNDGKRTHSLTSMAARCLALMTSNLKNSDDSSIASFVYL